MPSDAERSQHLIDRLLALHPGMKRAKAKARLKAGEVLVNGTTCTKATHPVGPDDVVSLGRGPHPGARQGRNDPEVLFRDEHLLVVVKPSGLLTVSGKRPNEPTVLKKLTGQLGKNARLYPCHRLDRETSGLLILPRTKAVQAHFFENWSDVSKHYLAVAEGLCPFEATEVDVALYEDPRSLQVTVSSGPDARVARTRFRVVQRGRERTLVEAELLSGRKHQVRVHLQHLGHPIVGDDRYGPASQARGKAKRAPSASRLCLHAARLHFVHPTTGQEHSYESPAPPAFARELARSRA